MEEKDVYSGEQPKNSDLALNVEEQQSNELKGTESGSPLGKFKSVDALMNAYNNLEKEFTQKCQKIKELTEKFDGLDNASFDVPEYQKSDWDEKVKIFFETNPMAKNYVSEISKVLSENDEIAKSKNSLQSALTKVLANKFVPYETLVNDDEFLNNYIYQNQKVKEKIVGNYLDSLQTEGALPLISSHGSGTVSSPINKPKTIEDAGKMVEAYLKNK